MATKKPLSIFFVLFSFISIVGYAQNKVAKKPVNSKPVPGLTISYNLEIKTDESRNSVASSYSGGVKTVFIGNNQARVRLVSLMRMQSVFILPPKDSRGAAVVVKESGKTKFKSNLSLTEWKKYNNKYDSATFIKTDDTTTISGYACRGGLINLKDGRSLKVYYTDSIKNKLFMAAEPSFKSVPGIVLQYEYIYKKDTLVFTATSVIKAPIAKEVFKIPSKGYPVLKYALAQSAKSDDEIQIPAVDEEEDEEDPTEQ